MEKDQPEREFEKTRAAGSPRKEDEQNFVIKPIPVLPDPSINPGETIHIEYYFTGIGTPPKSAKLHVNYTGIEVAGLPKLRSVVQGTFNEDGTSYFVRTGEDAYHEEELPSPSSSLTCDLEPGLFIEERNTPEEVPPILGEFDHDGYPPVKIEIPTSSEQSPGEYEITSVLSYIGNQEAGSDATISNVHVNSWVDRNNRRIKIASVVTAVVGVLLAIGSFAIDIWQYISG